jgi:hypothetical protein
MNSLISNPSQQRESAPTRFRPLSNFVIAFCGLGAASALLGFGFMIGQRSTNPPSLTAWHSQLPPEVLRATATHGTTSMAVCTASIDEESDGFFALDYLTGDLKGWVFNPRTGAFGGLFVTNIGQFLGPPAKNAEYLLVSGRIQPPAGGSTTRFASMVLYVVDVRGGQFAAFSIPWDRSMRNSGATQANVFMPVGGDAIRPPMAMGAGARKPPPANANKNAPDANEPNAPANNANPPKNNQNKNNNNNN